MREQGRYAAYRTTTSESRASRGCALADFHCGKPLTVDYKAQFAGSDEYESVGLGHIRHVLWDLCRQIHSLYGPCMGP